MPSDSEKDFFEKHIREAYAKDPAIWLHESFGAVRHDVDWYAKYYGERLDEHLKNFLQAVADSHTRRLNGLATQLICWIGAIAMIVALPACFFGITDGLVTGAIGVGLVVIGRAYWQRIAQKRMNRLDGFRNRFRELLGRIESEASTGGVVAEDKSFLEKCTDSILFPSVISFGRRKNWLDLGHVETLYIEYCCCTEHIHLGFYLPNTLQDCNLCAAAGRVRKHIEGALSALESHVESSRQQLVAQIGGIDANNVIDDFRRWFQLARWRRIPEGPATEMCESLCDREGWTFDEADKVRELCREREKFDLADDSTLRTLSPQIFDKLSIGIETAAKRCAQADAWARYNGARGWLADSTPAIAAIRCVIGRHNPEAMFRELAEQSYSYGYFRAFCVIDKVLPGITNWGYDPKLVDKECTIAWKYISKERGNKYDRERDRELQATYASLKRI